MRRFFAAYIAAFVPVLGLVVARNYGAYHYLFDSLTIHPDADQVASLMREAGFAKAEYTLAGFGTVALHRAVK
jgi:ubiquinone/menaquinone biosynthesis C-methylase UbiE